MPYFSMSKLVLKWAFKKPATCQYPFEPRKIIPLSRGLLLFNKDTCTFCTVCAKRCPTNAITVQRPNKRWTIDRLLCISCGYCVEMCPKKCLTLDTAHATAAVTKDKVIF